jgi:hypothetical protein
VGGGEGLEQSMPAPEVRRGDSAEGMGEERKRRRRHGEERGLRHALSQSGLWE